MGCRLDPRCSHHSLWSRSWALPGDVGGPTEGLRVFSAECGGERAGEAFERQVLAERAPGTREGSESSGPMHAQQSSAGAQATSSGHCHQAPWGTRPQLQE